MKIDIEKMDNCQVALKIEAEPDELKKSQKAAYQRLVNKVSVPGFRKGKAPQVILEQHVGKKAMLDEALEHLVPELYTKAVKSQELEPIAEPQIEITQTEPVVFKAIVPLKPRVELGDYHTIKLKAEPVKVSDSDIDKAIEQVREGQAVLAPVDRSVQPGDFLTLDVEGGLDGKPFLNHKGITYEVNPDSKLPLPGFAEKLVGAEKNKEMAFTLRIPDGYNIENSGGKESRWKVTIAEVKEKQLPELDDELAQSVGYDNLKSLREKLNAQIVARAEENSNLKLKQQVLDAIIERSSIKYPPILEEKEVGHLLEDEARRFGYQDVNDFLKRVNKAEEELKQELGPIARKRVINTLVLDKVAETEKIEISPAEVDNKVGEITRSAEDKEKMQQVFALPQVRESIAHSLRTEKTLDWLGQIATSVQKRKRKSRSAGNVEKQEKKTESHLSENPESQ